MKKSTLFLLLTAFSFSSIFGQNMEPSAYISEQISLNGTWKFSENYTKNLGKLHDETLNWADITVPGEWTMQGFTVKNGEKGTYYRTFNVPIEWADKEIFIRCDAIFSEAEFMINGETVGKTNMPMVAFDFPISHALNYWKENRITISIQSETLSDTLMSAQQYAAHQMGGILRKIYIYALPKTYLSDIAITTTFADENYQDAYLSIASSVRSSSKKIDADINLELRDNNDSIVLSSQENIVFKTNEVFLFNKHIFIKSPHKWTAETPYLYQLNITIKSDEGEQVIKKKVGFRSLKVVGNQFFVNGKTIKLKGVNRHEVHPLLGRSLNTKLWKQDAEIFKQANVNYIRTSHYPPSEEFISFCDSIGLYVELENPLCWIGHGANAHWQANDKANPEFYPYIKAISKANIQFFRNHPSIIIWSMANESVWTNNWSKLANDYAKMDPSRPATFHDQAYGGFNNHGSTKMPIANMHYPGPNGPEFANSFPRPLLYGEYAHLNTYNRGEIVADPGVRDAWGRGFKKMWDKMYYSRGCLGGAIWSGIDDVFHLPNGQVVGYGEWGPIDGWRRKKPEYFHMKKTYSPIVIYQKAIPCLKENESIILQVENRFDFLNLNQCEFKWVINETSGTVRTKDIPPHQFGYIEIYPQDVELDGSILKLSIISPQGIEIDAYAIEIGEIKRDDFPFIKLEKSALKINRTTDKIIISGDDFEWVFDTISASITKARINDKEFILKGANLMVIALKTDECSPQHKLALPAHNKVYTFKKIESIKFEEKQDTITIYTQINYLDFKGSINYSFLSDGELIVDYEMESKIKINPRQWGLVFDIDAQMSHLQWDRKGLWSWYPENHIGRTKGKSQAFPKQEKPDLSKAPQNDWFNDFNDLGSNDFRSTKENIYWASLSNEKGIGITVLSDSNQAFRAFINADGNISFLVASYSTGGGDLFFSGHYDDERKPLKIGDKISGSVNLLLIKQKGN
ncbi:MAG: glycoside hydrolase family 2 [Bacteroidales bacterium]|nr:glycoside hydrolase family 2 [Bacteroidales bacterium]